MDSQALVLVLVLNTDRQVRATVEWTAPSSKPWVKWCRMARDKLDTKALPSRFFIANTGEEVTSGNFRDVLARNSALLAGGAVTVVVSLGEEMQGVEIQAPATKQTRQRKVQQADKRAEGEGGGSEALAGLTQSEPTLVEAQEAEAEALSQGADSASLRVVQLFQAAGPDSGAKGGAGGEPGGKAKKRRAGGKNNIKKKKGTSGGKDSGSHQLPKQRTERDGATVKSYESLCLAVHGQSRGAAGPPACPAGLSVMLLTAPSHEALFARAVREVDAIGELIAAKIGDNSDHKFTNTRFYINTAYSAQTAANDPFPMLRWGDQRVRAITALVECALRNFGAIDCPMAQHEALPRLNVIVRRYLPGDVLGFHADQPIFTESIYGLVLENHCPSRGLVLQCDGCAPFMLGEHSGVSWRLQGPARSRWVHGYAAPRMGQGVCRTSVTFRFFRDEASVPKYNTEHDI